jgi:hypothetical protein
MLYRLTIATRVRVVDGGRLAATSARRRQQGQRQQLEKKDERRVRGTGEDTAIHLLAGDGPAPAESAP